MTHAYVSAIIYLLKYYKVKNSTEVIWGHRGKMLFLRRYNLSMLHSMTTRVIPVQKLETLYLCYALKGQHGTIWGYKCQILIDTIIALPTLMHASKGILNLPTSSFHLCSPFQQNR